MYAVLNDQVKEVARIRPPRAGSPAVKWCPFDDRSSQEAFPRCNGCGALFVPDTTAALAQANGWRKAFGYESVASLDQIEERPFAPSVQPVTPPSSYMPPPPPVPGEGEQGNEGDEGKTEGNADALLLDGHAIEDVSAPKIAAWIEATNPSAEVLGQLAERERENRGRVTVIEILETAETKAAGAPVNE